MSLLTFEKLLDIVRDSKEFEKYKTERKDNTMSSEIQITNPTFEEYFNSLNVKAYGELRGQYRHLWNLFRTPMKLLQ